MAHADPGEDITGLLTLLGSRGRPALDRLVPVLYDELLVIARRHRRAERLQHTLNTADIVHAAYVKLLGLTRISWQSRAHFLAVAAQAMRRVLIDYARERRSLKRGANPGRVTLDESVLKTDQPLDLLIAVDTALRRLERLSPRLGRVVECRFFAGMSIEETALAMGSSDATIKRDWSLARAWLNRELSPAPAVRHD